MENLQVLMQERCTLRNLLAMAIEDKKDLARSYTLAKYTVEEFKAHRLLQEKLLYIDHLINRLNNIEILLTNSIAI